VDKVLSKVLEILALTFVWRDQVQVSPWVYLLTINREVWDDREVEVGFPKGNGQTEIMVGGSSRGLSMCTVCSRNEGFVLRLNVCLRVMLVRNGRIMIMLKEA